MKLFSTKAPWYIVFVKEVVDNLRDKRTVFGVILLGALIGPVTFAAMFNIIINMQKDKAEQVLELPIIGQQYAPNLIRFLKQQGVVVKPGPDDPEQLIKDKDEDVILRIPADYPLRWQRGDPAMVEVISDKSRRDISELINRSERLLQQYGRQIGNLRLTLRGVNANIAQAVMVRQVDLSTPQSRGALLVGMLPFFLLMTVFMGGMYLAIDATAGEKERLSLEPLLINPVPRWQVMLGKVFAASTFSALSMICGLIAFHFAMKTIPVAELGFELNLGWPVVFLCMFITLPLTLIASCLQSIIAAFAKGFREAQGYASMVVFIPMVPSFWLNFNPVKEELWMSTVPLLSQVVLLNQLIRGEELVSLWLLNSWLSTLALGALLALIATRLYNRPKMIFSD